MVAQLDGHIDLIAISLDGPPQDHDQMRGRRGAFEAMIQNVPHLGKRGLRFGFLFTLTQQNVHQLDWAARLATKHGASLLQIHPLEAVGRAARMGKVVPDQLEEAYAILEALRLQHQYEGLLRIQIDLTTRQTLSSLGPCTEAPTNVDSPLANLVSPLVVEPDGECVPLEYGFPRSYGLGNIKQERLLDLAPRWIKNTYPRYATLLGQVMRHAGDPSAPPASNWYAAVAQAAAQTESAHQTAP